MSKNIWTETLHQDSITDTAETTAEGEGVLAPAPPPLGHAGECQTTLPPSMDDDPLDLLHRTILYPDWDPATTFVISGPLPHGGGPGRSFKSAGHAERWVNEKYGGYLQHIKDAEKGGRWAFRVKKPVAQ